MQVYCACLAAEVGLLRFGLPAGDTDSDGVVDFRQGLEYYNYARRAGKPVILLVYPGADHGLREESQQVDYHRRILEWFGHWLKGEPAPEWITEGETWVEREKRMGG